MPKVYTTGFLFGAALSFVVLASFGVTLAALTLIEPREPPVIRLKPTIAPFVTRVIEYRYC